jgi:hypothetical protein
MTQWEVELASYNPKRLIGISNISAIFGQGGAPSTPTGSEEKHFASN